MYGIPSHVVAVIKHFYANFSCSVGNSDLSFLIKSGLRQGCVMSGLLFNIVIDWVLCRTTEGRRREIRWSVTSVLEDLDYGDDIVLLSHSASDMPDKTDRLNIFAQQVGLNISTRKTEATAVSSTTPVPITVGQHQLSLSPSLIWKARFATMEEQMWILSKGSAKLGPPSYSYDLCGDVESIVGPQR